MTLKISSRVIDKYKNFIDRGDFIPIEESEKDIWFWVVDEEGIKKADYMAFTLGLRSHVQIKDKKELLKVMEEMYGLLNEEAEESSQDSGEEEFFEENIIGVSYSDAPIVKLVNQLIVKAVQQNASDIHFEGTKDYFVIRFRIDGMLHDYRKYSKKIQETVISRIKVMAGLDVAETRRPQDGAIRVNVGTRSIDIRVSVVPSITGEKAALRILDTSKELLGLEDIGMSDEDIRLFEEKLRYPNGLLHEII